MLRCKLGFKSLAPWFMFFLYLSIYMYIGNKYYKDDKVSFLDFYHIHVEMLMFT